MRGGSLSGFSGSRSRELVLSLFALPSRGSVRVGGPGLVLLAQVPFGLSFWNLSGMFVTFEVFVVTFPTFAKLCCGFVVRSGSVVAGVVSDDPVGPCSGGITSTVLCVGMSVGWSSVGAAVFYVIIRNSVGSLLVGWSVRDSSVALVYDHQGVLINDHQGVLVYDKWSFSVVVAVSVAPLGFSYSSSPSLSLCFLNMPVAQAS